MNRDQSRASRPPGAESAADFAANPAATGTLDELFRAAVAQYQAGALAEAERTCWQILQFYPGHPETHDMLGSLLLSQGKVGEAIPHFERVIALRPNLPIGYDNLGRAYMAAGKPEWRSSRRPRARP